VFEQSTCLDIPVERTIDKRSRSPCSSLLVVL
jgi:hypothetical protein